MGITLKISKDELAWFIDSPDAGQSDCICSYCGFEITEDDFPFRMFRHIQTENGSKKTVEARFHEECFKMIIK